MILPEDEEFLKHYGKKGMKWGVRQDAKLQKQAASTDKRTKTGKKVASLAKESKKVQDAGGGFKGGKAVRKAAGSTKKQERRIKMDLGARMAVGALVGGAGGYAIGKGVGKILFKDL